MAFYNKLFGKKIEQKSNPVGSLLYLTGQYRGSFARPENYIKLGYEKNPTIKECVDMIAGGAASVEFCLMQRVKNDEGEMEIVEVEDHPVMELLDRPNPTQTRNEFFKQFFVSRLVTGNAFLIADQLSDAFPPTELWNIPTYAVQIQASDTGVPSSYKFVGVRGNKEFPVNTVTGMSQIYHSKDISLSDPLYGISPLTSVRTWVDVGNEGAEWNASLLQNGARTSGILKKTGAPLTDLQYSQLRQRFEQDAQGSRNAGVPMVLDNGLEWTEMGINPKDMDFANSLNYSDKKICGIYGVPYVLMSPDASTFNNVENARRILWEDTISRFLDDFLDSFDNWLLAKYPDMEGMFFSADYDDVPAFQAKNAEQSDRAIKQVAGGVITPNEAREVIEREAVDVPEADELHLASSLVPIGQGSDTINNALDATSKLYLDENPPAKSATKSKGKKHAKNKAKQKS